jgi:hypothetical protein
MALDDLQVDAALRLLAAELHARLDEGAHRITQISQQSMENTILAWHYIFGRYATRTQSYQSSSLLMHRATVEDG